MIGFQGQAGAEIEITEEMVKAGVYAAKEHCLGEGLEALVSTVFMAMRLEELDAKSSRLINEFGEVVEKQPANS